MQWIEITVLMEVTGTKMIKLLDYRIDIENHSRREPSNAYASHMI